MVLDTSLLNTQQYKVCIKWSNPGKGVAPSPTPWCSSNWKGSFLVALDYGRQLYLLTCMLIQTHPHTHTHIYIYIYIYIYLLCAYMFYSYIYIHIYVCTHTHTHTHAHTHTHTHTYIYIYREREREIHI